MREVDAVKYNKKPQYTHLCENGTGNSQSVQQLRLSFSRSSSPVNVTPTEPYIHRLPVELLQQVFLLIVNDVPDCPSIFSCGSDIISVDVASPPLVFIRVCRLWRVVAHSTAGVWSRIQVVLPGKYKPLKPFLPYLLQCWLARSGSLPLTLYIVDKPLHRQLEPDPLG
ncbi:hypothetical protein EV702DRAFT_717681 [Suillus placidus]|uniref:F-box domain-containing protein n=1 Tax=Suillus placidus TaxID=48579 RepID=A0A9P6ZJ88_9AGAM|nr:hypothetical protein EV702DRAFT_717681 [Suillus placidus]